VKKLMVAAVVCVCVAGVQGCRQTGDAAAGVRIQTESGLLAGKVLDSGVRAWMGIPFAQPPVRDLRWKEAQPITWKGVYNADRKMAQCPQVLRPHNINHYFGEEPTSEDCLYMNVWAPPGSNADSRLPVIVFIYGGEARSGRPAWPTTTASRWRRGARSTSTSTTDSASWASWRTRSSRKSRAGTRATTATWTRTRPSSGSTATSQGSAATRERSSSPASRPAPVRWRSRSSARCRRGCSAAR